MTSDESRSVAELWSKLHVAYETSSRLRAQAEARTRLTAELRAKAANMRNVSLGSRQQDARQRGVATQAREVAKQNRERADVERTEATKRRDQAATPEEREHAADERDSAANHREAHAGQRDEAASAYGQSLDTLRGMLEATASPPSATSDATLDEIDRLRRRVIHLEALLRNHDIDPGGTSPDD